MAQFCICSQYLCLRGYCLQHVQCLVQIFASVLLNNQFLQSEDNKLNPLLQAEDNELIMCRERMTWLLSQCGLLVTGYQKKSTYTTKSKKRKVEETESDDIYDGIKRLYEESGNPAEKLVRPKRGSCASEMHQDVEDIHPFVQAVAAV